MELDTKDKKILSELINNSDRPQKTLSNMVGTTESEFTRKKTRLIEAGVIQGYTIKVDHQKIGFNTTGYFIFAEKDKGEENDEKLVKFLQGIEEVIEINQVFGKELDFVLKIMCPSNNDFFAVIGRIRSHPNVNKESSYSAIIAKTEKNDQITSLLNRKE